MPRGSREIRRLVVLAIAIAGFMLGTCPPGAPAKPAKPAKQTRALPGLFGVTIWEPPTVEEFQRMSMGGVR